MDGSKISPRSAAQKEYQCALRWMEKGDLLQAEACFRFALAGDSLFVPAYLGLSRINLQRNKTVEARRWLDKVLKIDKNYLPAHLLRARLFFQTGEYQSALRDLEFCNQVLESETSKALKAEVYLLKARVFGKLMDFSRSQSDYRKVLQLFPGHPEAGKELRMIQTYEIYSRGLSRRAKSVILKKQITRADLAVLFAAKLRFLMDSAETVSDDVQLSVRQGWLPLLPDSSFRPNDVVDRAELTLFLTKILLKYKATALWNERNHDHGRIFNDIPLFVPLFPYVQLATAFNLLDFIRGDEFHPRKEVSGLEALQSTTRLAELLKASAFPAYRQGHGSQQSK